MVAVRRSLKPSALQWPSERGALTREPLLDQRVDVIRDEGHGGEISHLRLADDLDASALLPLPVDIRGLHTAETNQHVVSSVPVGAGTTGLVSDPRGPFTVHLDG